MKTKPNATSEKSATTQQSNENFNEALKFLAFYGAVSRDELGAFIEQEQIEFDCSCNCPFCHLVNSGKVEKHIDDDGSEYYMVVPQYIEWEETE